MSVKRVKEILAAHADALVTDGTAAPALDDLPDRPAEAEALMEIAERTRDVLHPIPPPPVFRSRLHDSLRMAARLQQSQYSSSTRRRDPAWRWLLGAAALGSAAGVIAIVLRSRAATRKTSAHLQN